MDILLTVLILIASIGLILVVMVQKSKGGGLASSFASANNIMGVRKSTDFLEKATWWLFGVVAVLCIVVSTVLVTGNTEKDSFQNAIEQQAAKPTAQPSLPAFGGDAPATTPTAPETTAKPTEAQPVAPATEGTQN